jgi:2-methylisocitrate lyase-like PEP mutase family enzyme
MGSVGSPPHETAATKLRKLISSPGPIILAPGVYDGFSARIALSVGFDTIYMVRGPNNSSVGDFVPRCGC